MELQLYSLLSPNAKKAIVKTRKRYGAPYTYNPRGDLLQRLSIATGMSITAVRNQLMKEREYLIKEAAKTIQKTGS